MQTSFRSLAIAIATLLASYVAPAPQLSAQARAAAVMTPPTSGARRAFTPADWYRVTTLNAPAVSPDGKLVAFTVTTVRETTQPVVNVLPPRRGDAIHVAQYGELEPALLRGRQVPAVQLDAPRVEGSHVGAAHGSAGRRGAGNERLP